MKTCLFAGFRRRLARAQLALTGPYKLLLTRGFAADAGFHDVLADVSKEVQAKGYIAGGVSVPCEWATEGADEVLHGIDATWPDSSIEADGAVLYVDQGDNPLVCYWHFAEAMNEKDAPGGVVKSRNAPFRFYLPDGAMRVS